jgi:hypothetical protein
MVRTFAFACAVLGSSLASFSAQAEGGCGIGFHRGPYGGCRPNGAVVVAPAVVAAPVVVAPPAVVVAPPVVCGAGSSGTPDSGAASSFDRGLKGPPWLAALFWRTRGILCGWRQQITQEPDIAREADEITTTISLTRPTTARSSPNSCRRRLMGPIQMYFPPRRCGQGAWHGSGR